tara:strand:+ start:291 stop:1319 length:1029 start_codon:yes stop_codon:yes gene_type:complete
MKYNGLDVYDITLGKDDIGIRATSLVTLPAMESQFLHFNEDKPQFIFASEEKRELIGAIMIPEKLIYRNIDGFKFWVNFTADTIRKLTSKMIKSGTAGLFTIQHKHDAKDGDIDVQEVWIKESDNDKSMDFGIDEPIGTSFMKVKVNDELIWKEIKESGLNGFSIELDASIIEKNELLFNKEEEPKKEVKMNITDVFTNSVEVNGVKLHFNSDLKKNTYLVTENEAGLPEAYTGDFSYESIHYNVVDGVVLETVNVELSTKESIESLSAEFKAVKESMDNIMLSKASLDEKEAELALLQTQFEADKEAFAALKSKGVQKFEINLSKAISDKGVASKNWLNKF